MSAGAIACVVLCAAPAAAQAIRFELPAQDAAKSIPEFARQADVQILVDADAVKGRRTSAVNGRMSVADALRLLLRGSGLHVAANSGRVITLAADDDAAVSATDTSSDADIVVTGSNIRGNTNPTVPVISFSRKEIEQSGQGTTQELLATLPQNYAGGGAEGASETGIYGSGADRNVNVARQSGVNLRGLNSRATLTLINGHRVTPGDQGLISADISMIPLSAVERIDILADGASAIYGADAVAGVVNVVLRKKYDGQETSVRAGASTDGGSQEYRLTHAGGTSWNGGSFFVAGEYYDRPNMAEKERSKLIDQVPGNLDILPDLKRVGLISHFETHVADGLKIVADGILSRADSHYRTGDESVTSTFDVTTTEYNLVAGLEYEAGHNWLITANGSFGRSRIRESDVSFDMDGLLVEGGNGTPDDRSRSIEVQASGPLVALPAGNLSIAVGASHLWSHFDQKAVSYDSESSVPIFHETRRQVTSAYAELSIPLIDKAMAVPGVSALTLSAAARYDHYSDFGNTFNPKLGVAWSPFADLDLRGSYSTSFRAPSAFERVRENGGIPDLFIYPFVAPGGGSGRVAVLMVGGSQILDAEKSTNYSLGGAWHPHFAPGLTLGADWYQINYRGRIDNPPLSLNALNDPSLSPFIVDLTATGAATAYARQFLDQGAVMHTPFPGYSSLNNVMYAYDFRRRNMAIVKIAGIDFNAAYTFKTGGSDFSLRMDVAHIAHIDTQLSKDSESFDRVNTLGQPVGWRGRGSFGWSKGPWTANAAVNYVNHYVDETGDEPIKVGSYTTLDFSGSAALERLIPGGAFKALTARLSVLNLFNSKPPYVVNAPSRAHFDPAYYDVRGRFVSLTLTKRW